MERVSTLTNIVLIPLLILSGVFNKFTSMPVWSAWLQYLSPFRYGTHLFLQNEYGDEIFTGAGGEYDYRSDLGVNLSYINNFLVLLGLSLGCYITSFILLKYYATKIAP
jgi:ABC-type multidrug transport system permease subunit